MEKIEHDGLEQAYGGKRTKNRQTGMNLMQHGEEEQVYCIETIKSGGDGQCVGARNRNEREGRGMFPPLTYGRGHITAKCRTRKRRSDVNPSR